MLLAWLLIGTPIVFNAAYLGLALRFEYPGILRRPTQEVLEKFRAGGSPLILLWWVFSLSVLLFVPIALLAGATIADPVLAVSTIVLGVAAAILSVLGLIRWVFLVPYLARAQAEGADPRTVDLVFQAFHRYLGVAVGEHLGTIATGAWTILLAAGFSDVLPPWLSIAGVVVGIILLLATLEFVGPFEEGGWSLIGLFAPIGYILWSVWLIGVGIVLLVSG